MGLKIILKKIYIKKQTQIPLMTKIRNFRLGISTQKCNKFYRQYICYVVETKIKKNKNKQNDKHKKKYISFLFNAFLSHRNQQLHN